MQTFLPHSDFEKSAKALDNKRLNKQIVEVQQILKALSNPHYGWRNHPAVKMWRGFEASLRLYGGECYREYRRRFFNRVHKSGEFILGYDVGESTPSMPAWLGNPDFHLSHRSNLMRKDRQYYAQRFGDIPDNLPYIWPV